MKSSQKDMIRGLLTTAVLLPLLLLTLPRFEFLQAKLLCAPTAFLAGLFFGVPSYAIADGYAIATARPVEITIACSAVNFFALAVAVFAGLAVEKKCSLRSALWLLPGAYLLTLLANAARVISTQYTDAVAAAWLPGVLHSGVHALAGALIFMFTLAVGYYAIWRYINEYEKNKASA